VVASGGDELGRYLWADVLRNADKRDLIGIAARRFRSGGDAFANALEIVGDTHTAILYRLDLDFVVAEFARIQPLPI
jgi:hypothetical protein